MIGRRRYTPETEEQKMSLYEFGEQLLKLEDLDPVYPVLYFYATEDRDRARRAILAYALFYDLGASLYLSSKKDFWVGVYLAAVNSAENPTPQGTRWPRAAERRHFRGTKCVAAVEELNRRYPEPERLIEELVETGGELAEVLDRLKNLPQFGPWIAFKLCDIGERVLEAPILFPSKLEDSLYSSPLDTVRSLAAKEGVSSDAVWEQALAYFSSFTAPPRAERGCGVQEIETIFCKYGSYLKGHYYPGKDLKEIRHSLKTWGFL
jgi:Alpha-glutamyl/putrescinyl thymine pyrophosphorylase clade 2